MRARSLEMWGGVECTVARIRDDYRNQIDETGHRDRIEDLEAIRSLGIETLRYPALWEMVAPEAPDRFDWAWVDQRFSTLQRIGLKPIVGLLHHGSGPRYTSLLDPALPDLLARFAGEVASRYPWVDRFTPVNEPLTTARFSGLYGHWFPHAADEQSFLRMLVIQCKATLLAMRAIRAVTPGAQLIQTEDVGKTFSTPALEQQAEYENGRRWLSLDLLCGRVTAEHPWYEAFRRSGVPETDLELFLESDGTPDLIGVNHYLTSERYLDEDLDRYPRHLRGGSDLGRYADVEAVRVELPAWELGPAARLREVWQRYGLPIAITEVHHGCTREEQLRWLDEVWGAAERLRQEDVDIRAVTVWALFGAQDWNSLLTEQRGAYEPGAFDVRAPRPRLTAIGKAVASLVSTGSFDHPLLATPGWWHRPERLYRQTAARQSSDAVRRARPLLVVAARTPLADGFAAACKIRGIRCVELEDWECDVNNSRSVEAALAVWRPWAVVDAGHLPASAAEETSGTLQGRHAAKTLGRVCAGNDLPLLTFSSDCVFDPAAHHPCSEFDGPRPVDEAGCLMLDFDQSVMAAHPKSLVIRTGPIFGAPHRDDFGARLLRAVTDGTDQPLSTIPLSPGYLPDLVHAALDLLVDGEKGFWHLSNPGESSEAAFAARLAAAQEPLVEPATLVDRSGGRSYALRSDRGSPMPPLDDALARFVWDVAAEPLQRPLAAE